MATKTKRNRKPTSSRAATKRRAGDSHRTKAGTILDLLQRPTGASINELTKATGWQPHSVRSGLTGLRKKGREIARSKDDRGVTRYCIEAETQS